MARPGISTKNTEKIPLGPNFWNPKKIPQKYQKKYQNTHFWYFGGIFSVFSGYFGGKFWESRISGRGVFFRYFSWKFQLGPFRGSVAGRGVLKYYCREILLSLRRLLSSSAKSGDFKAPGCSTSILAIQDRYQTVTFSANETDELIPTADRPCYNAQVCSEKSLANGDARSSWCTEGGGTHAITHAHVRMPLHMPHMRN